MTRHLIALFAAAALAATGLSSAPVQARDRGETAAIVAGATALAIAGTVLASDRHGHRRHHGHVSRGHGDRGYDAPRHPRGHAYGYRAHRGHGYRPYRGHGYRPYYGRQGYGRGYGHGHYRHDGK